MSALVEIEHLNIRMHINLIGKKQPKFLTSLALSYFIDRMIGKGKGDVRKRESERRSQSRIEALYCNVLICFNIL